NPNIATIKERLFPFIEKLQAAHPGKPLIFQRTIYREGRNFNVKAEKSEADRIEYVDSIMAVACKKYKDVYYVKTTNASDKDHSTSQDGTHPTDYGYKLWAESVQKPIVKILKKYGIK
ncbi:MAG: lipase, partial [Bacteroidales bacterium]|nr:lipase [Bacteroidales bacterium]